MNYMIWIIIIWHIKIQGIKSFFQENSVNKINLPTPLNDNSLFGFSIASINDDLVISAPREGNTGHIYNWNTKDKNIREITVIDEDANAKQKDMWLGAVITTGSDFFVTCTPRFITSTVNASYVHGICYKFTKQSSLQLGRPSVVRPLDSVGWSMTVDQSSKILVGGPVSQANDSEGSLVYVYSLEKDKTTHQATTTITSQRTAFNFGYSITSGNFLSETQISYALSSTYGTYGEGQVIFVDDEKYKEIYVISENTTVGSMFGASLCTVKLDGPRSSLLVGAPAFTTIAWEHDHGAVYLYAPNYKANATELFVLKRIIKGMSSGGYFGNAVISLGDIDGDGKDEVAIGAPYDDNGKGAVYIYSGHGLLTGKTAIQIIRQDESRSYGFSLTALNSKTNVCKHGLGVGAPFGDVVYMYNCIPTITTTITADFPNLQSRVNLESFNFAACVHIEYPKNWASIASSVDSEILLKVVIIHQYATLRDLSTGGTKVDNFKHIKLSSSKETHCFNFFVLTPEDGKYNEMIKYNITTELNNDVGPTNTRVTLSDRSVRALTGKLWAADCHIIRGICAPDLQTEEIFTTLTNPYNVSTSKTEKWALMLQNKNEIAYNPCVEIAVKNERLLRSPPSCTFSNGPNLVVCKPLKPVKHNGMWLTGDFEIDTELKNNLMKELLIEWDIYHDCDDRKNKVSESVSYKLLYVVDVSKITISGQSSPAEVLNATYNDLTYGSRINHIYLIGNAGDTDYYGAKVKVIFENKIGLNISFVKEGNCSSVEEKETDTTKEYFFEITLMARDNIDINFNIFLSPESFRQYKGHENVSISSELFLYLEDKIKQHSVSTILVFKIPSVDIWIIALSCLVGLAVILLCAIIMYKLNFFERKSRKQLKRLRDSVRESHHEQTSTEDH